MASQRSLLLLEVELMETWTDWQQSPIVISLLVSLLLLEVELMETFPLLGSMTANSNLWPVASIIRSGINGNWLTHEG